MPPSPPPSPSPSPPPAAPILASHLITDKHIDTLIQSVHTPTPTKTQDHAHQNRLSTSIPSINEILNGGLIAGSMISICGGEEEVSSLYTNLMTTSLLEPTTSSSIVVIIDTTGNFNVVRLYNVLVERLRLQNETHGYTAVGPGVEEVAGQILERVKMMRPFDFEGLGEAVGEVRWGLESTKEEEGLGGGGGGREVVERLHSKRGYVVDSEDEEEEEEEMLFESGAGGVTEEAPVQHPEAKQGYGQHPTNPTPTQETKHQQHQKVNLILINNLSQIITPFLKKDYLTANAQVSTFLTSLNDLTRTHNLHTLIGNSAAPQRISTPSAPPQQKDMTSAAPPPEPAPTPSIFTSNVLVPCLMDVWGRYVDVCLLVGLVPKRRADAKAFYGKAGGAGAGGMGAGKGIGKKRGVEMVCVLEVLWDRWEGRGGGWCAFERDGI
ncbi:hypothetical protein BDW02DRAFT_190888 [Decorospora gaudefroyi]|uniref:DNA recombination and repair protein Rad51-like C-terminal domain-containing protein n=1 Tax=Decorospora gaudefroyi TaxID=184978 RepID=A0A6A5JXN5_9PLEO|nr:hypothetical protein BDW02DRAFT_190888 [Decorospora gaudefroyi]